MKDLIGGKKKPIKDLVQSPKKKFIDRYKKGLKTAYDADTHIGLLFDIYSVGGGLAAYLDEAKITKHVFYRWQSEHQDFKEAYEAALNMSMRIWEEYPKTAPNFNLQYWHAIMRNRFKYGKSKFKISKTKTAKDLVQSAKVHLDSDDITIVDYSALVNSAKVQAIIDGDCSNSDIYVQSTKEELLEKKAILESIVERQKKIQSKL